MYTVEHVEARAMMPDQVLEDALNQVGYRGSLDQFRTRIAEKGWGGIPFKHQVLKLTTDRISRTIDDNRNLIPVPIFENLGAPLKEIVHAFCYKPDISGDPEFPTFDRLWIVIATLQAITSFNENLPFNDGRLPRIAGRMLRNGMIQINRHGRFGQNYAYLGPKVDPFLTTSS